MLAYNYVHVSQSVSLFVFNSAVCLLACQIMHQSVYL